MDIKENINAAIEQYRLYIDSKEKFIDRNFATNKFFLVFNALMFLCVYLTEGMEVHGLDSILIFSIIGMITSFLWWSNANVYDILIHAKLKNVIDSMESQMPIQPHILEQEAFQSLRKKKGKYDLRNVSYSGGQKVLAITMIVAYFMIIFIEISPKIFDYILQIQFGG